jgi:hypothetical protein
MGKIQGSQSGPASGCISQASGSYWPASGGISQARGSYWRASGCISRARAGRAQPMFFFGERGILSCTEDIQVIFFFGERGTLSSSFSFQIEITQTTVTQRAAASAPQNSNTAIAPQSSNTVFPTTVRQVGKVTGRKGQAHASG